MKHLLEKHPQLRPEAEQFATSFVSSASTEDIAGDVQVRITSIDLDALNGRAGKHSWGYVEPGDAAVELLEESIDDLQDDMKRKAELGLLAAAQIVCIGIVEGFIALGTPIRTGLWAGLLISAEHAFYIVSEFIRACSSSTRTEARRDLLSALAECAPEWAEGLERAADQAVRE
ncbi:MAG: hypothetical protein U1G07_20125 [Verrucomicrobiota bacterium]